MLTERVNFLNGYGFSLRVGVLNGSNKLGSTYNELQGAGLKEQASPGSSIEIDPKICFGQNDS